MKGLHEVRNYPSGFMVWQDCYDNMGCLAHWHQEIELIYIRRGKADICIEDSEISAKKGDLVIIDTGALHYIPSHRYRNRIDFILFDMNIIWPNYQACFFKPLVTAEDLERYGMTDAVRELFDTVHTELEERDDYYKEIVSAKLKNVMYSLRRYHLNNIIPMPGAKPRLGRLHDIRQLLAYIDEHYAETITLEDAARQMNLSSEHFSRTFSKVVGINYISYLNMVRVEHAAKMICSTDAKMIDVALSCGFTNIRVFNRCFKQYTGYPPTQFMALPDSVKESFPFYRRKLDKREYVQGTSPVVILTSGDEADKA